MAVGLVGGGLLLGGALAGTDQGAGNTPTASRVGNGLTPAERNALRIVSVKVQAAEPAGLLVTARFAGNVEEALGRGHLGSALVAVILHPKVTTLATADVATRGAGAIGETLRKTHSTDVGVVRDGHSVSFFVGGPGASSVGSVEVKTFASFPPRTPSGIGVSSDFWEKVEKDIALQERVASNIDQEAANETCSLLRGFHDDVLEESGRARLRTVELKDLMGKIDADIARAEKNSGLGARFSATQWHSLFAPLGLLERALTGTTPYYKVQTWQDAVKSLKLDRRLAETYLARNEKLVENLTELKGRIEGLIKAKCTNTGTATPASAFTYAFSGLTISFDGPNIPNIGRTHVSETYSGAGCGDTTDHSTWKGVIDIQAQGVPAQLAWATSFTGLTASPELVYTWNYKDQDSGVVGQVQTKLDFFAGRMGIRESHSGDIVNLAVGADLPVTKTQVAHC